MRIISGIQPSGALHLGNYLGAVAPFLRLQAANHQCLCMIADGHALTSSSNGLLLRQQSYLLATQLLALGVDPSSALLFRQSDVPEHLALTWILATCTPMGLLERAHSYKDKLSKGLKANVGLFTYPILMAADILLYAADQVPVGPDQRQHLEMTRDIADKFNLRYPENGPLLKLPEAYIVDEPPVCGTDGDKMSKSYGNTLELFADPTALQKTIMSIATDSTAVSAPKSADSTVVKLLRTVYAATCSTKQDDLLASLQQGGVGYGTYKKELLEAFLAMFATSRHRYQALLNQPDYVENQLQAGAAQARKIAQTTYTAVAAAVGLSASW